MANIRLRWRLAQRLWRQDPYYLWALITYFGNTLGGDKSRQLKVPSTDAGEPLPWYTYPAITYLAQLDFSRCAVFEYGAGNSSRYWAQRAQSVTSVEADPRWYEMVCRSLAENQTLTLQADQAQFVRAIQSAGKKFDLIVIDAAWRYNCAVEAILCLQPNGMIILDNSDWYPNTAALLRANGFGQVDFVGWSPLNLYASCTSLFSQGPAGIPRRPTSVITVPGGLAQLAEDDKPM